MLFKKYDNKSEFNKKRTRLYISAMEEGLDVRKNELMSFDIDKKLKNNIQNIVDIGAGNGYLTKYLAKKFSNATIYAADASGDMLMNFKKDKNIILVEKNSGKFNIKSNSIDAAFSLATVHHITDKKYFLKEVYRILKPGGFLFIADVNDRTTVQVFFDTIVKKYCITKHDFDFLDSDWISYLAKDAGFILRESKIKNTPWIFNDKISMINFIKKLTGLKISDKKLEQFLYENFKITRTKKTNLISLPWQLGYYALKKGK